MLLWLYEGMTEYFTMHMPVKTGLHTEREFFKEVEEKINYMNRFNPDLSMTDLSLHPMEQQDQYYNVYLKGALINLCLDLKLCELSGGEYGAKDLVLDLMAHYRGKPFEDNKLFSEMAIVSGFPELKEFAEKYIQGTEALPLEDFLLMAGLKLVDGKISDVPNPTPEQQKIRKFWLH